MDAAVRCRGQLKDDSDERFHLHDVPKTPYKVSDKVAEGVIQCLEELLKKCHLGSVDQVTSLETKHNLYLDWHPYVCVLYYLILTPLIKYRLIGAWVLFL